MAARARCCGSRLAIADLLRRSRAILIGRRRREGPRATFSDRFELGDHWKPYLPSELLPED